MEYKTLIPDLVTLDSPRAHINNMYLSSDFSYYPEKNSPAPFHYRETCVQSLLAPRCSYDFRNEYFSKEDTVWHYNRPSRFLRLNLTYDTIAKSFSYTPGYKYIPFEIGGVLPVGEIIADIINYHLFLAGYIIMRGMAYTHNGKTICVTAPGFNGKTYFLDHMIRQGAQYIAEDLLVLDINKGVVYPTSPFVRRHQWQKQRGLTLPVRPENGTCKPQPIDRLYCIENSMNPSYTPRPKTLFDFLLLDSRYFMKNRLIRSMIFEEGTWEHILEIINSPIGIQYEFVPMNNFDYGFLERNK